MGRLQLPRPAAVVAFGAVTSALLATVIALTGPATAAENPATSLSAGADLARGACPAPACAPVLPDVAPPSPAPAPPVSVPSASALVVGDSIALGSADSLRRALGAGTVVDAKVGRQFSAAPAIVGRWPGAGPVVVDLGANGTVQAADIDAVVASAGDRRVVLVGVHVPRRWQDGNNDVLRAAAAAHPTVEFVDWGALVAAHPGALGPDGVHPGLTGRTLLASAVADAARHP